MKKTVKAWAVFNKRGRLVFAVKQEPEGQLFFGSGLKVMREDAEIRPVTITYELPPLET